MNSKYDSQNDRNSVLLKIREIVEKSANNNCIYRGEPQCYPKVSSNLYRQYADDIEDPHFDIEVVQKELLDDARKYSDETDDFEILAEIQHYGGKTNLIDFTTDYHVALFFACVSSLCEDGRVIVQKLDTIKGQVKQPRSPKRRVKSQDSVFVRLRQGFMIPKSDDIIIIPKNLKQPILNHLQDTHNISIETIYNDVHGYIENQTIPQNAYTEFYKGFTCQQRGDSAKMPVKRQEYYENAVRHYTNALERNPYLPEGYNNRGLVYRERGELDRAIQDYDTAIELAPDSAEAYSNRGGAYCDKGELDRAIQDCEKAIELEPEFADAYNNYGLVYRERGEFNKAIANYNRAIELRPDHALAYNNRGGAYGDKGEFDKAIADHNKAIELKPDYAEAYTNRGFAYAGKGESERSIQDYNKAIELKPDEVKAYGNRGNAYLRKGEPDRAIQDYNIAIKLRPDHAVFYNNRGGAYSAKGEFERAIQDYDKAIELKPDDAGSYYNRGLIYRRKGEFDKAIQDFNIAVALNPNFANVDYTLDII